MVDWCLYENSLKSKGYKNICGVDEAGRGPLAGPVFSAAVILPDNCIIEGINDSKKLTEKKRNILFDEIKIKALSYSIASASVEEIDNLNILNATFLSMQRAISGLSIKSDFALIDGNRLPDLDIDAQAVIKGDSLSQSIAAASILAKVTRDRFMLELDKKYSAYLFAKHKGYGTKLHIEAIKSNGVSDIHRRTFLKKILKGQNK